MDISDSGWLTQVRQLKSKNYNEMKEEPYLIVVHSASLPLGEFGNGLLDRVFSGAISVAEHPELQPYLSEDVSTHVLIDRAGEVTQYVSFNDRAWHAGVSQYKGRDDCNSFSIGIELEGCDFLPYNEIQYVTLNELVLALQKRYPIQAIVGHDEVSPHRKTDPGPSFDWNKVAFRTEVR